MTNKEKSDRGKWFISLDGSTAIRCEKDSFLEMCKKIFGKTEYREKFSLFRSATFEEYCSLELDFIESTNL